MEEDNQKESSASGNADDQDWRTFVRQFTVFCFNILLKIPKGERKFLFFTTPIRVSFDDFPENACLRESSYEKLRNLTSSELEGVVPIELSLCINSMLKSKTPREFEGWLDESYNDFHTPKKLL